MRGENSGRVVVIGATGAVGREVLGVLAERGLPARNVRALASEGSAGTGLEYGDSTIAVEALRAEAFRDARLVIFAATSEVARDYAPLATAAGAIVVDNSSHFRLDPRVALVVPEVNGDELSRAGSQAARLIANPNCSTIILSVALEPLRRAFGIERVHVATYQAVSGAGLAAIDELKTQATAVLSGSGATPRHFKEPCAFNVFSHDSAVDAVTGRNVEEQKIIDELRRLWQAPDLPVTPTCVRVPVVRAHTQAITVEMSRPATEHEVREALAAGEGLAVIDDRAANCFPTPLKATGRDEVLVGRIRLDPGSRREAAGRSRGVCLMACGDQLRKGAALNAVQIAELCGALPQAGPSRNPSCNARSTGRQPATIVH